MYSLVGRHSCGIPAKDLSNKRSIGTYATLGMCEICYEVAICRHLNQGRV